MGGYDNRLKPHFLRPHLGAAVLDPWQGSLTWQAVRHWITSSSCGPKGRCPPNTERTSKVRFIHKTHLEGAVY
ncbi:unnamed protein product [Linum trigynum]|uniref:Uncharacterized protein n=1 Tax=Linum trigynum TaxID=586398 RepID=A0AAV2DYI3_9ROSI